MTEPDPREVDDQGRYTIPDGPPYAITGPLPDDHPQAPGWHIEPYDEVAAAERKALEAKLADIAIPGTPRPWVKYYDGAQYRVYGPGEPICLCPEGTVYVGCPQHGNGRMLYSTAPAEISIEIQPDFRGFESVDGLEAAWRNDKPGKSREWMLLVGSLIVLGAVLAAIALGYGVIPW